jgi:hypothetical protein
MSERPARAGRQSSRATPPQDAAARGRFVKTLVSVLGVQVVTLVLLWLLQSTFSY